MKWFHDQCQNYETTEARKGVMMLVSMSEIRELRELREEKQLAAAKVAKSRKFFVALENLVEEYRGIYE
jgi:hypothetical protein